MPDAADDDRSSPTSDWTRRADQAKADGSWYADREQTVPLTKRSRRLRFLAGFAGTMVLGLILRVVFDAITGRHQPFSADELIDGLISGTIFSLMVGGFLAYPSVRRKY